MVLERKGNDYIAGEGLLLTLKVDQRWARTYILSFGGLSKPRGVKGCKDEKDRWREEGGKSTITL